MNIENVIVFGATEQQGRPQVREALRQGYRVKAVSCNPITFNGPQYEDVQTVRADYDYVLKFEETFRAGGFPVVVFRPGIFMDNLATPFMKPMFVNEGVYRYLYDLTVAGQGTGGVLEGVTRDAHAADFDPRRRELALKMGADVALDPREMSPYASIPEIGGRRPDLIYECVGKPGLLNEIIGSTAPRARIGLSEVGTALQGMNDPASPVRTVVDPRQAG